MHSVKKQNKPNSLTTKVFFKYNALEYRYDDNLIMILIGPLYYVCVLKC